MQVVLDSPGMTVKKQNNYFFLSSKDKKRKISPIKVDSFAVLSDCSISASAIKLAAVHEIPIYFFDRTAKLKAVLRGPSYGSIATIRRQQVFFGVTVEATQWVISLFEIKAHNQIANLKYLIRRKPAYKTELIEAIKKIDQIILGFGEFENKMIDDCRHSLMGIEGSIAMIYWRAISSVFPDVMKFENRSRRPAKDYFNASLNYLYGMLYSVVGSGIVAAGMDTHFGILHVDEYNKPTFTFDMIEPFRPWIDQLLIKQVLDKKLDPSFFRSEKDGFYLSKQGKQFIIPLFNNFLYERKRFNHNLYTIKNHIYHFAGAFAQNLLNKK